MSAGTPQMTPGPVLKIADGREKRLNPASASGDLRPAKRLSMAQMCTCPSKFSKVVILGGSLANPRSFQPRHTETYTSFFSSVRHENVLMYSYSSQPLMKHFDPHGRMSGDFWHGSR